MKSRALLLLVVLILYVSLPFISAQYNWDSSTGIMFNESYFYVSQLSVCTEQLVQSYCPDNITCPGYSSNADILSQCQVGLANLPGDPCASVGVPDYDQGLHIAAVFIILVASGLGAGTPLLAKYHPGCNIDPLVIILGKCLGIGIVLACALIHMLQPGNASLTSTCLPYEFWGDYNAYAFLYAMLAVLAMHAIDTLAEMYLVKKWSEIPLAQQPPASREEVAMVKIGEADTAVAISGVLIADVVKDKDKPEDVSSPKTEQEFKDQAAHTSTSGAGMTGGDDTMADKVVTVDELANAKGMVHMEKQIPSSPLSQRTPMSRNQARGVGVIESNGQATPSHPHGHGMAGHDGHVHSILLLAGMKRTISAYLLEFGVTVHSVFIGLENGVVGVDELKTLLVALVFHQMFEGIALGSRIADANLPSHYHEFLLSIVFSLAAPIGIAIGIGVTSAINPNGEEFLMIQGTFDSICGGILLYIGLVLLLKDFPEDMQRYCGNDNRRKAAMFVALYTGAGVMAYIGKYL